MLGAMRGLSLIFLIVAIVCFAAKAFDAKVGNIDFAAVGLAFFAAAFIPR